MAAAVELFAHASLCDTSDAPDAGGDEWEDDEDDLSRKIDFEVLKKEIEDHFDSERKKLLGDLDLDDQKRRMCKEAEIEEKVLEEMEKDPPCRLGQEFERKQRMYDDTAKEIMQRMKDIEWSNSLNAILCGERHEGSVRHKGDSDDQVVCSAELEEFFEWIINHHGFNCSIAKKSLRDYLIPLCNKHNPAYLGELVFKSCQVANLRGLADLIFEIAGDDLLTLFPDMEAKEIVKLYSSYLPSARLMTNYLQLLQDAVAADRASPEGKFNYDEIVDSLPSQATPEESEAP